MVSNQPRLTAVAPCVSVEAQEQHDHMPFQLFRLAPARERVVARGCEGGDTGLAQELGDLLRIGIDALPNEIDGVLHLRLLDWVVPGIVVSVPPAPARGMPVFVLLIIDVVARSPVGAIRRLLECRRFGLASGPSLAVLADEAESNFGISEVAVSPSRTVATVLSSTPSKPASRLFDQPGVSLSCSAMTVRT